MILVWLIFQKIFQLIKVMRSFFLELWGWLINSAGPAGHTWERSTIPSVTATEHSGGSEQRAACATVTVTVTVTVTRYLARQLGHTLHCSDGWDDTGRNLIDYLCSAATQRSGAGSKHRRHSHRPLLRVWLLRVWLLPGVKPIHTAQTNLFGVTGWCCNEHQEFSYGFN